MRARANLDAVVRIPGRVLENFQEGSRGSHGDPEDQRKRLFRPRPQFPDQTFAAGAHKAAKDERHDDRIVELPSDWNEVGDQIERQSQVAN